MAGQAASEVNATAAATVCAVAPLSSAGNGRAATSTVAAPPTPSTTRPGTAAGRSEHAVTRWQTPSTASAAVISHRSCAPRAARELIVWVTESKPAGCRVAATVHPPINSTGAAADESTPHHAVRSTPPAYEVRAPLLGRVRHGQAHLLDPRRVQESQRLRVLGGGETVAHRQHRDAQPGQLDGQLS